MTVQLMKSFYGKLMAGESVSQSLREAQVAVRSMPGGEHPYYWAAFSAFGQS
jgi:CHAT domain-containing protein